MRPILTLKARLYSRDGAAYGSGDPFLYDGQGSPSDEKAEIYKVGQKWRSFKLR
jgi:hypothetical protein